MPGRMGDFKTLFGRTVFMVTGEKALLTDVKVLSHPSLRTYFDLVTITIIRQLLHAVCGP